MSVALYLQKGFFFFFNNFIITTFEEWFDIFVNAFLHFLANEMIKCLCYIMHVARVCLNSHQGAIDVVARSQSDVSVLCFMYIIIILLVQD